MELLNLLITETVKFGKCLHLGDKCPSPNIVLESVVLYIVYCIQIVVVKTTQCQMKTPAWSTLRL